MRSRALLLPLLVLAGLVAMDPPPAAAQDETGDLNELFEQAGREVSRGHFDRALGLYLELTRRAPEWPDVWYNLGEVSRVAEHPADCVLYFRRFLFLAPEDPARETLERAIDRCASDMTGVGRLEVAARPEEATILVDGIALARGVLAALPLAPGPHEVRVETFDFEPAMQVVDIANGEVTSIEVALSPIVHHGLLRVRCDQEGARVTIDDEVLGVTPLTEPIDLVAGESYLVRLTKEGYYDWVRRVEIGPEEELVLDVEMQELDPWEQTR